MTRTVQAAKFENSIIRILNPHGQTVGAGFLVANDLAVTCAHVIDAAGNGPDGDIDIVFHVANQSGRAHVDAKHWSPASAEDVAFLCLKEKIPEEIKPALLTASSGAEQHSFFTFGFPDENPVHGLYGDGHILRMTHVRNNVPVLQLSSPQITLGFSGAPVFDTKLRRTIGMVSVIVVRDRYGRLRETALITPTETLENIYSKLKGYLKPTPPKIPYLHKSIFVGRQKEIQAIRDGMDNRKIVIISGIVGVGKSHLAAKYLQQDFDKYEQVHWLDWNAREAIDREQLDAIIQNPDALLILDNAEDIQWLFDVNAGEIYLGTREFQCRLLITTRHYSRSFSNQTTAAEFEFVRLKPLLAKNSVTLLLKTSQREPINDVEEIEAAEKVCRLLGNLPFAIEKAGSYLANFPNFELSTFLEKLQIGEIPAIHNEFSLLWESLPSPLARQALKTASLLCVKENRVLKSKLARYMGSSVVPMPGCPYLEEALLPLDEFSLLEETTPDEVRLSPLVISFVTDQAPLRKEETLGLLGPLYRLVQDQGQSKVDRQQAALLLTQLKWFDYLSIISIELEKLIAYLELIGRSPKTEDEYIYLIEKCTAPLLKLENIPIRQRTQLLDFQGAFQATIGKDGEAAKSYEEAGKLLDELLKSQDFILDDYKLSARIKLGHGNLLSQEAETIIPKSSLERQKRTETLNEADHLYEDAIQDAKEYGQDPTLIATIYGEQSYSQILQANWHRAEELYQDGIDTLREYIHTYANMLEIGSSIYHGRNSESTDNKLSYQLAREEIMILERLGGDSTELVVAHLNAAETAMKSRYSDNQCLSDPINAACKHWKAALPIAIRLGIKNDAVFILKQLQKFGS